MTARAISVNSIQRLVIVALAVVVILGGIQLKRQADRLETTETERRRLQQEYEALNATTKERGKEQHRTWEYSGYRG